MPENYAIEAAANHDYEGFYRTELFFRETLGYPPFSDILQISVYAAEEEVCAAGAERVKREIFAAFGGENAVDVMGPKPAPIARIGSDYRYHLYLKARVSERRAHEKALSAVKRKINTDAALGYRIMIDVNPYSLM
jgi:primosomal protein N' (replication factor Y)